MPHLRKITREIESRSNLDCLTKTYVRKMLLEGFDGSVEAKGVEVCDEDGNVFKLFASEIVVAAGAFESPQILETSGIGSREVLERYGIDVRIDNPGVGETLQDHCFTSISFEVADDQISGDVIRDPAVLQALVEQYQST